MISIEFKKNDKRIEQIVIKGHANYSEKGKDIVCASATTILIYSLNLIEKLGLKITYQLEEGYSKLVNDANNELVDKIFETIEYSFNSLYEEYPKNIFIKH
jgi:uncharacterized protein YsxB (DUF464 family)